MTGVCTTFTASLRTDKHSDPFQQCLLPNVADKLATCWKCAGKLTGPRHSRAADPSTGCQGVTVLAHILLLWALKALLHELQSRKVPKPRIWRCRRVQKLLWWSKQKMFLKSVISTQYLALLYRSQNLYLFQRWHPVSRGTGVGYADPSTVWATLDVEEAGAEIMAKYVYRKQEWQQRRVGTENILPVVKEAGVNPQADVQIPQHHLKSHRHGTGRTMGVN